MSKIFFVILFLVTSALGDINWAEDIDDAYSIAAKDNKQVMVMLSQEGCPACEYMKGVVFEDKKFMSFFNKDFIAVYIDIHEDFVPERMEYFATPTFYFLNAKEKVLHKITGAHNSKEFKDELELIEN